MNKTAIILLVGLFIPSVINSQQLTIPSEVASYYKPAKGYKGAKLKSALCAIIYNRHELDYKEVWNAFERTDIRPDGKIWDLYSGVTNYQPTPSGSNYSIEGDCYNREHSFPSSWFGGKIPPMYTDLHHIYPTDGYVNGRRGNNPLGETAGEKYKSQGDFSKLGKCTYPGYTGVVFEPNDKYKGDVARTYFYIITCYEEKLPDWYNNKDKGGLSSTIDGTTYPGFTDWQLSMLMKWAESDPVSEKEINRNNAIYSIQHNRNPFIDFPGLELLIWGNRKDTAFDPVNYRLPF